MENKQNEAVKEVELEEVANDMSFFLPENIQEAEEVERVVSRRVKDDKGNPVRFKFKPIETERIDELEKQYTNKVREGGRFVEKLDSARFHAMIAIESTVYPNFKDAGLRKAYRTEDPVEVAKSILSVGGEYGTWIETAMEVNGFTDTFEDLEEAAKNS